MGKTIHLRAHFDEHSAEIRDDLIKMSQRVQKMLQRSCELLELVKVGAAGAEDRNALADKIIKDDIYVDIYEASIDDHCLQLIATEQPVASDLRQTISITKVTSDLERIGDIARYIAVKLKKDIATPFHPHIPAISVMYSDAIGMLERAVKAFVNSDEQASRMIAAEDDAIDKQYEEIQHDLIRTMKHNKPDYIKNGQLMLETVRFVELLGDRVTSICEWTIFAVHGKHIDLN